MIRYNLYGFVDKFDFDIDKIIKSLLSEISKKFSLSTHEVSFIIVSSEEIRNINNQYRHIDKETDVISFAEIDSTSDRSLPFELGEIFINYERVYSQAKEYGHSIIREFAFLCTHGMLHLLGFDHMTKEDEEVMFSLQDEILDTLGIRKE